jgi:predicted DNA-binding transcriptional regulator AlpA
MTDAPFPSLNDCRLIDIRELAQVTGVSVPSLWRHQANRRLPASCRIGRAVRWRLRTGDPATGVLDWIEAGCVLPRDAGAEDPS